MPALRAYAMQNARASLVMRQLSGFGQHVVQHQSFGSVSHGSILVDTARALRLAPGSTLWFHRFHLEVVMTRARFGSWLLGVVLVLLFVSRSLSAIGPAFIVLHGGSLESPIVIRPEIGSFMFMWAAGNAYEHKRPEEMKIPSGLQGRGYIDYDVYWGRFTPEELKSEAASQHGRLYPPTAVQPAVVVITAPAMTADDPRATRAPSRPIPSQLEGFVSGRALTTSETAALVAAGVPMK
jgi:hypothetical protein